MIKVKLFDRQNAFLFDWPIHRKLGEDVPHLLVWDNTGTGNPIYFVLDVESLTAADHPEYYQQYCMSIGKLPI